MNPSAGLPLVKFSTIADSVIRRLPHAVASDRRVMCAALNQSWVVAPPAYLRVQAFGASSRASLCRLPQTNA